MISQIRNVAITQHKIEGFKTNAMINADRYLESVIVNFRYVF